MNEHIHNDIVQPDGSVRAISSEPLPHWNNGAAMGKPRDTRPVILASAPRAMKQPRKDVLRDALRNAADRIEAVSRERDAWRDLAEREPEEATPFSVGFVLAIGFIFGAACMAVAGWAL